MTGFGVGLLEKGQLRRLQMAARKTIPIAVAIFLTGCWSIEEWREKVVGHVWVAKEITGVSAIEGSRVTLVLQTDGTASGWSGCNNYRAPYRLAGETLHFGAITSQVRPCTGTLAEQARRYLEALGGVEWAGFTREPGLFSDTDLVFCQKQLCEESGPLIRFRED